ncbi:probable LRR receptor-like serine/threonine-protein kinase At1g56140 isoform X2 [Mangifera indica]|uniref:probable LRR receptor-like serine/threonine-protein kinase At1g56140 isoform X2 n=1 Tax=Mangifera indica TaxID=29780 RepID=UPI001CFBE70C|nr:probable LRR receptor-like serine/threonine-protein kinase At1g56140 isoform X2 [Mangifera indica]
MNLSPSLSLLSVPSSFCQLSAILIVIVSRLHTFQFHTVFRCNITAFLVHIEFDSNSLMLMKPSASRATSISVIGLCIFCCFFGLVHVGEAQNNQTQAATDPNEVSALNAIFEKWGISANEQQWNISGEPCSGAAIDDSITIDDKTYDPFIKCVCSFNNNSVCRITALKVYALDVSGAIPDELWTLTSLTNLNLGQNFLTGPLSPSIANLTAMQYLSLGINALSGELPKELGLLTELILFGIGTNNFSGPLPSELGDWTKLEQLYIDSSGVSGEIPSSFANLQSLTTVWASDTELTGKIPDFIGTNWTKLNVLRLQGNSFTGPIPSSFATLTSLTELRMSDLSNGSSSSLAFIRNMKSLSTLDLSFNNLSGQIPSSLFNLSLLTYLFLGNNNLDGTLPAEKSTDLLNIDLSYNNLSGSFPSWINQENLQLNLVANNFKSSVLPYGLYCLQRTFPCDRDYPIYSSFAVKSGGPQITSSDDIVYERDNETLGPATYYMTDSNRWGVSNVGYFTGSNNPQYIIFSQSQFTNTLDSELFQTARISASSLRYYGLGLENGNYTVTLQFAEIANLDSSGWKSLGRRLFDIYVQGNRVEKDFNIKSLASGIPRRVFQREYKALVSENYLEIHFFWAGKGTCCVPSQGTYGPLISAISATPDFIPTVRAPTTEKNRTDMIVGIVVGVGVAFLLVLAVFFIVKRRKKPRNDDEELLGMDVKPYTFSYAELRNATDGFSPANKLGEGGFGPVFKGKLSDGRVIAVKQLSVASHQGKSQFAAEIATISAVQHRNLVKLYGCCYEGAQRILVYEYLENNSLDQALFGNSSLNVDWPTRYDICLGVAKGLAYLHEESRLRIIHRDVKASNILLDANLVPKISDFGLAKLYDDKKTHISTRVAGTIGYLAPEYAMRGHLTEKTDVFAFGVVTLEIVSGRPNSDSSLDEEMMYLLEWAWFLYENNRKLKLVDSKLSQYSEEEVRRLIGVALLCTQTLPSLRPSMSRVVAMLCGDIEVSPVSSKPGYLTDWKFDDGTIFFSENATKTSVSTSRDTCLTSLRAKASPGNEAKGLLQDIIGEGREKQISSA